jgi:tRNA-splicing ligase RtcB
MNKVITTERLPIKLWLDDIEDGAMEQAKNLANLPFAFHHIVLCPDAHKGYGMPIGGVMATKGVVVPNAVGLDVACGVVAAKTSLQEIDTDTLKTIMGKIRQAIPVGFNSHKEPADIHLMPEITSMVPVVSSQFEKARKSLGTLGGGNHFLEIQQDNQGFIWIMIHSGSRNLGKQVADYYNKKAVELNEKYFSVIDKKQELAFLPLDTEEAHLYLAEMEYCIGYAYANRMRMLLQIAYILTDTFPNIEIEKETNIAHNYARMESHFGQNVLVHRKGATSAREGEIGIIPGSQGTKSYIVKGLGNPDSFNSCSHGAGRAMGRKDATRRLDLAAEQKRLDDQGIIHGIRNIKDLDEAAGAYKDISVVMANQSDLVEIVTELSPLAVIKG